MMESANANVSASDRAEIFYSSNSKDPTQTLACIVRRLGDYLTLIVGEELADTVMEQIVAQVRVAGAAESETWRGVLEEFLDSFTEWPLGSRLFDLAAYAHFGILLSHSDSNDAEQWLSELILEAQHFMEMSPIDLWLGETESSPLQKLMLLAEARWALDHGNPIGPGALAEFGGVSEGRVRNMMSGANRVFTIDENKKIPAQEALAWLQGREQFWNSIWREESKTIYPRQVVNDPLFIPVSRDGSVFHPGLSRDSTYTIGKKGAELHFASYEEALSELQRMDAPAWRRPNDTANWGLVTGIRWERLHREDLDLFVQDPRRRLKFGQT